MISHFLLTCTPLLVRSVWQWKLIFFSLRGDITMINFSMEWRKLEDCCNMRSEINLLWCEKSRGMWGINKYEITLSVFSSNRKRASFGKALLWRKCDPLWPSLGWKELGNGILSIYRLLFQYHKHYMCSWQLENQFRGKDWETNQIQCLVLHCWFYVCAGKKSHVLMIYLASSCQFVTTTRFSNWYNTWPKEIPNIVTICDNCTKNNGH